jgi:hypothetical protein
MTIRTMSSARLYTIGRVAAFLTITFVLALVLIGALAVTRMHPPRAIQQGPKTSAWSPSPEGRELGLDRERISISETRLR